MTAEFFIRHPDETAASLAQLITDEPEAMAAVFGDRGVLPKWTIDPANPNKWIKELRTVVLSNDGKIIREVSK